MSKKFTKPKISGKRLKQNYIKLRETKLGQYNITLPKGIVEALDYQKGSIFKVVIKNGNITLIKDEAAEEESE